MSYSGHIRIRDLYNRYGEGHLFFFLQLETSRHGSTLGDHPITSKTWLLVSVVAETMHPSAASCGWCSRLACMHVRHICIGAGCKGEPVCTDYVM